MIILYVFALCLVLQSESAFRKGEPGVCVSPGSKRLRCCSKWFYDQTTNSCHPECPDDCKGGRCVAPNKCHCDPPLVLQDKNQCVPPTPTCDTPCTNGRCTGHNTCTCDDGYTRQSQFTCKPKCTQTCVNGECIAPDTCRCYNGYTNTSAWKCEPVCGECFHGTCVAPNRCECYEGYTKLNGTCKPTCRYGCRNGFCNAPDTCTCDIGYATNPLSPFNCVPICDNGCVNATCAEPNFCKCYYGFEPTSNHTCAPKCSSCEHGACVSPELCVCNKGYQMINGSCTPVCDKCINGFCTEPNVCSCHDGFINNSTLPSLCYKPCVRCENGECDINGHCLCQSGFVLENDTCVAPLDCKTCEGACTQGLVCACKNGSSCVFSPHTESSEVSPQTGLAGLELTWLLGGCLGLVLMTMVIVVIGHLWRKRRRYESKQADVGNTLGSVAYTVRGTLTRRNVENQIGPNLYGDINENEEDTYEDDEKATTEELLATKVDLNNEKFQ